MSLIKKMRNSWAADGVRFLKDWIECSRNKYLCERNVEDAISKWFKKCTGEQYRRDQPVTFNQKTQWMKVNDSTPLKGRLADKYLVREYVSEIIGSEYLIPLLGVYDSVEEINFHELPERCVIKATHGSSWNIVVSPSSAVGWRSIRRKLQHWLKTDFSLMNGFEFHYRYCTPRIIIEEYQKDYASDSLDDYKVYCFNNGSPVVCVCKDRFSERGVSTAYYDREWSRLPITDVGEGTFDCPRPPHLKEMVEMSERLAESFAFVRVDWYETTEGLKFGEMTFTSASGRENFDPPEWNIELGKRIDLSMVGGRHGVEQ